jgi:hypothetical protein
MGVQGESGAYFFREVSSAVVTGSEFQVHAGLFAIPGFVFDPNIGDGNLAAYDLQSMRVRDGALAAGRMAVFSEPCDIVIEVLLNLVGEDDPEIYSTLSLYIFFRLLIEPVNGGVVVGFAGLGKSVVERLTLTGAPLFFEQAMPVLGEREQLARTHFLMRNGLQFDEALAQQVFDVRPHARLVAGVGELREILLGNGAEFAEFHHACDFGVPQTIAVASQFVDAACLG